MENRVKALYLITIIAILAFLGMQIYWLYGRYCFALAEHESSAYETIVRTVSELNRSRGEEGTDSLRRVRTHSSKYNINYDSDSSGLTRTTVAVISQKYYAHEILGIKDNRPLTPEEQERVARMLLEDDSLAETQRSMFEVRGNPSEGEIWGALKNVDAEFLSPMREEALDTALRARNLTTKTTLLVTDSMIWEPSLTKHASPFNPVFTVSVPYSALECKSVLVEARLPVTRMFRDMAGSLAVVAVLSLFLIICLLLQFATVLRLSRLDRMRNSFITTMIHELKRPIATLKMCVSGLGNERMLEDPPVRKELLAETRTALDNLSAYFSRLRDITFNNVEQIPLNITIIPLHELFNAVTAALAVPPGKSVDFINDIPRHLEVSADRSHLYNILNNLVENAVKYSGDSVEIRATASRSDGAVVLAVADSGNGISPADLRHVFKRFYRGKASAGEQPGMGLGLAYVRLLVEAHGGEIAVVSTEGIGTCFTIKMPQ